MCTAPYQIYSSVCGFFKLIRLEYKLITQSQLIYNPTQTHTRTFSHTQNIFKKVVELTKKAHKVHFQKRICFHNPTGNKHKRNPKTINRQRGPEKVKDCGTFLSIQ